MMLSCTTVWAPGAVVARGGGGGQKERAADTVSGGRQSAIVWGAACGTGKEFLKPKRYIVVYNVRGTHLLMPEMRGPHTSVMAQAQMPLVHGTFAASPERQTVRLNISDGIVVPQKRSRVRRSLRRRAALPARRVDPWAIGLDGLVGTEVCMNVRVLAVRLFCVLVWGGGGGTRPWYLIVCLWRRLLASRHCSF